MCVCTCCKPLDSFLPAAEYPPAPQQDPGVELLEQFKAYLKHVYQQPRSPHRCFEKPGSDYVYQPFNLKLVETERSPLYELTLHPYENKEIILLRMHNNVDLVNKCIAAVDMADIGSCPEWYSPDCILVQGAPGVGKSAFAWELSRKWAKGEVLKDWSLVILVQLEDKTVREAKSLQDFIYHPNSTVRKEVYLYLKKKKGSGKTLFILDGYDLLSDEQRMNASWLQKLVAKALPKATLMILCRTKLTAGGYNMYYKQFPFDLKIDKHFDISVFTDEDIDKHITSACSGDPRLATALKSYLSSHPFIHSLMYIPLQCAMVTDLYRIHWKCGDKEFAPRTMTELYTDLVRTLLLRYLSTHPEYSLSDDWVIDKFTDLQSLPGKVYERFEALAKLAALGIEKRVYVFDDSNLPEECQSLDLVENSLGLMYQVEEVYPGRGRSVSYRFLHLTLQEYLAAYHCSLDPTNRLEKVAGSLDNFLSNYHSTSVGTCDHLAVWLFTAGLTKLSWLYQPFLPEHLEFPSIAVTPMLHLLYEAHSPSLILENLSFSSDGSIEFKFFDMIEKSPVDCFVAGYCIPYSSRLWHLKTDSSCTDKHFDFLSKGLNVSSCRGCSGRIEKLEVHTSKIAMLHLLHPHTKALGELTIYAGYVDGTEKYAEQVVYNQFPSWYPLLKVLNIVNVSSLVLPLFEFLPKMCSGSLERLQLDFSPLRHFDYIRRPGSSSASKEDKDTIFKQLKECPVKQLEIKAQSCGHYPPLTISCKVESLQLTELTLTPALAKCVGIEHNALHTLVLHSCEIPADASTALVRSLQSPHCVLETIELDCKHDSSKIPDSVVEAIASCHTLKRCSMINFKGSILEHFVAGLKKNESRVLEELTMCCNSHGPHEHISELICVANEWSSIAKLRLSSFLKYFVHQLDINFREDLIIDYISV